MVLNWYLALIVYFEVAVMIALEVGNSRSWRGPHKGTRANGVTWSELVNYGIFNDVIRSLGTLHTISTTSFPNTWSIHYHG
jgi:hypothetical protein